MPAAPATRRTPSVYSMKCKPVIPPARIYDRMLALDLAGGDIVRAAFLMRTGLFGLATGDTDSDPIWQRRREDRI